MKRFLAAIRFLTILPIPGAWGAAPADLAGSVVFFPIVGLLLGCLAALAAWGLSLAAPPMLAAALLVALMLAFSGGLHADGLSDTADGFLSSRPRERILEIMRDSHVGVMGVLAIVAVLLVKFAALASVGPVVQPVWHVAPRAGGLWAAALLAPLAGRTAIVIQMALLRYVRPAGLGTVFGPRRRWAEAIWSVLLLSAVAWLAAGIAGLAVAIALVAVAFGFAAWCQRKIGGATGDTFGAACEIGEVVPAVVLAMWR